MRRIFTRILLVLAALVGLGVVVMGGLVAWVWTDPPPHHDISLPFELTDDKVIVTAELDGKPIRAQLDTGAPLSMMDLAAARERGMAVRLAPGAINGRPRYTLRHAKLTLGGQRAYGVEAVDMPEFRAQTDVPLLLGVLGLIDHRVAEFDFNTYRLVLHRRIGFKPPAGAKLVRLSRDSFMLPHYGLPVMVNGHGPFNLLLDLGSNGGMDLSAAAARKAGVTAQPGSRIEGTSINARTVSQGAVASANVAGYAFPQVRLAIAQDDRFVGMDGSLGVAALREFHIWLDLAGSQAWLQHTPRYAIGVDDDEQGRIRAVMPGGPAERAGLAKGQRILRVNGEAPTTYFEHRDWSSTAPLTVEMADGRRLSIAPQDVYQ